MLVPLERLSFVDSGVDYNFRLIGCCVCRDVHSGRFVCHHCAHYINAWSSGSRTYAEEASCYGSARADVGELQGLVGFQEVYATAGFVFCVAAATSNSSSGFGAGPVFCFGDSGSCGSFCVLVFSGVFFPLSRAATLTAFSQIPTSSSSSSCSGSVIGLRPDPSPVHFPDPSLSHSCSHSWTRHRSRGHSVILDPSANRSRTCRPSGSHLLQRDLSTSRSGSRSHHTSGCRSGSSDPSTALSVASSSSSIKCTGYFFYGPVFFGAFSACCAFAAREGGCSPGFISCEMLLSVFFGCRVSCL